jgi:hypothetical protein
MLEEIRHSADTHERHDDVPARVFRVVTHEGAKPDTTDTIRLQSSRGTPEFITLVPERQYRHDDTVTEVQQGIGIAEIHEIPTFKFEIPNVEGISMSGGSNTALLAAFDPISAEKYLGLSYAEYTKVLDIAKNETIRRIAECAQR